MWTLWCGNIGWVVGLCGVPVITTKYNRVRGNLSASTAAFRSFRSSAESVVLVAYSARRLDPEINLGVP
jgi:hypothetical protein